MFQKVDYKFNWTAVRRWRLFLMTFYEVEREVSELATSQLQAILAILFVQEW